ncbi:glycosyltransferase [Tenacibaculum maritimum]|uniref:glycosyltransferase n=1 Tax=Tenacibaculum maritimum TaxID=107401 RepID=UPI0012E6A13D|nr:glycosyltransferase [Tenacibaculum maritimum]CAA0246998.1 Glycosyltransferase, family GT2 [Tenacibaculum maritimum]
MNFAVFAFSREKAKKRKELPISVIVYVKNNAEDLLNFLPSIIQQNYSNFEIVLINNASHDQTLEVMEKFQKKHHTIKIVNVENNEAFWGSKKYALTLAIKAATNEHLLFTDINGSKPLSKNWIAKITSNFSNEKSIILGYNKYIPEKYSFVNLLARFDNLLTSIQYFSYAKFGIPYMGDAKNIAYTKTNFFKTKGFINHIKIHFGEDSLFIRDAANRSNTAICSSMNSFINSNGPKTLKEWYLKKQIQFYVSKNYKLSHKFLLYLFTISKIVFISTVSFLIFYEDWKVIGSILLTYFLVQYIIVGASARRLRETKVLFFLPVLEIILILFQFSIFITNRFLKPINWK